MHVEIYRNIFERSDLTEEWNRLEQNSLLSSPFSSLAWAKAWLSSYHQISKEYVILGRRSGSTMIMPLMIHNGVIRSMCFNATDYTGSIYDNRDEVLTSALVSEIVRLSASHEVVLWNIKASDPVYDHLKKRKQLIAVDRTVCKRLELRKIGGCAEKWITASATRRQAFRDLKRLTRDGAVVTLRAKPNLKNLIEFMDLHDDEWRQKGFSGKFEDPCRRNLLMKLYESGFPIRASEIRIGGNLISYNIYFEKDGHLYFWNSGFNFSYRERGPGLALIVAEIIDTLASGGPFLVLDFLRGDERYKNAFATDVSSVETTRVKAFAGAMQLA